MTTEATETEEQPEQPTRSTPDIFSVLGWVMGGLSFLNLIRDFTPLKLYGLVAEWVGAYGLLVRRVAEFLFGWMEWRWISVSDVEGHVIVLGTIFCTSVYRAGRHSPVKNNGPQTVGIGLSAFFFALLLPGWFGTGMAVFQLLLFSWIMLGPIDRPGTYPFPQASRVRRELLGVLAVFSLIVLVNYTVFRP